MENTSGISVPSDIISDDDEEDKKYKELAAARERERLENLERVGSYPIEAYEILLFDSFPNVGNNKQEKQSLITAFREQGRTPNEVETILAFASKLHTRHLNYQTGEFSERPILPHDLATATELLSDPETRQQFQSFANEWHQKFLLDSQLPPAERDRRIKRLKDVFDTSTKYKRYRPLPKPTPEFLVAYFEQALAQEKLLESLPGEEFGNRLEPDRYGYYSSKPFPVFIYRINELMVSLNDASLLMPMTELAIEGLQLTEDEDLRERMLDTLQRYVNHHVLPNVGLEGFRSQLFPALIAKDANVEILAEPTNNWGMRRGDFGIADAVIHSLISEVSPLRNSERMIAARLVPTMDKPRFEQNRRDALALAGPFGALRDFIHDQQPYVHQLVSAMVHYYDTGDATQLELIRPNASYVNVEERWARILQRENYDAVSGERAEPGSGLQSTAVPAIDLLRRIQKNTEPIPYEPPTFGDETFDSLIQGASTREGFQALLENVNQRIAHAAETNHIGLTPRFVSLLNWIDHRAFKLLQGTNFEAQQGFAATDFGKAVLTFHELTASPDPYNQQTIDAWLASLQELSTVEAAKAISRRTTTQTIGLAKHYRQTTNIDTGALWSGNLTHELMTLTELRTAATPIGERYRRESLTRDHPGD